jgi:hypothetical protein
VIILGLVLGSLEGRTPKDAWRNASSGWLTSGVKSGEYLKFLAEQGYTLSAVEEVITGEIGRPPTCTRTRLNRPIRSNSTRHLCVQANQSGGAHPPGKKKRRRAAASPAKCPSPPNTPAAARAPGHPRAGSGPTRPPTPPQANPRRAAPQTVIRRGAAGAPNTRNSTEAPAAQLIGPPRRAESLFAFLAFRF